MEILKSVNKFTNKLSLLYNSIPYGSITFFKKNNIIYLSNIFINEKYKNRGYGTLLINKLEEENRDIKIFKLCAWEPTIKPNVINFYKKNGYKIDENSKVEMYDDGENIYDLIKKKKII